MIRHFNRCYSDGPTVCDYGVYVEYMDGELRCAFMCACEVCGGVTRGDIGASGVFAPDAHLEKAAKERAQQKAAQIRAVAILGNATGRRVEMYESYAGSGSGGGVGGTGNAADDTARLVKAATRAANEVQ